MQRLWNDLCVEGDGCSLGRGSRWECSGHRKLETKSCGNWTLPGQYKHHVRIGWLGAWSSQRFRTSEMSQDIGRRVRLVLPNATLEEDVGPSSSMKHFGCYAVEGFEEQLDVPRYQAAARKTRSNLLQQLLLEDSKNIHIQRLQQPGCGSRHTQKEDIIHHARGEHLTIDVAIRSIEHK